MTTPYIDEEFIDEDPTCDTCGQPEQIDADLSIEWCGDCGSCLIHCEKQEGCAALTTPTIAEETVIAAAADLLSDDGENSEYDRAIIELAGNLLGFWEEDREMLHAHLLRVKRSRSPHHSMLSMI